MKKGRVKAGLKAVLPFIYCLLVQVICGAIFGQIFMRIYSPEWVQNNLNYVVMTIHLIMVLIFGLWYLDFCITEHDSRIKDTISLKSIGIVIFLAYGTQFITRGVLLLVNVLTPETMEKYAETLQNVGIGNQSLISIIAVTILAPIGEECIFRGITLRLLEKTELKFWIINIIQALLFGIMHGNLVQGTYAIFLGLVLGYVAYKYRSVFMSILVHLVYNTLGISNGFIGDSNVKNAIVIILAVVLFVIGFILILKEDIKERPNYKKIYSFSYYKAFTPKLYRVLVHIVLPVIILIIGVFTFMIEEVRAALITSVVSMLMLVELFGDFVAFGASCNRDAAPINWLKSSIYGRKLIKHAHRWDGGIRFLKFTVMWMIMGLCPLMTGDWEIIVIGYLASSAITFFAVNIIRRIENVQMSVLVTMPSVGLASLCINFLPRFKNLMLPIIVVMVILLIISIVMTYKSALSAFEKSYHDAV